MDNSISHNALVLALVLQRKFKLLFCTKCNKMNGEWHVGTDSQRPQRTNKAERSIHTIQHKVKQKKRLWNKYRYNKKTYMRLLGGIFRPSLNQVTCGWGKLRMRGAGITAPSPWETDWVRSPSSKLPITTRKQTNTHKRRKWEIQSLRTFTGTNFPFFHESDFWCPQSFCHLLPVLKCYIELPWWTERCCYHGFHITSRKARRNQDVVTHIGKQRGR